MRGGGKVNRKTRNGASPRDSRGPIAVKSVCRNASTIPHRAIKTAVRVARFDMVAHRSHAFNLFQNLSVLRLLIALNSHYDEQYAIASCFVCA
jgi:hypothetical protein